MSGNLTHCVGCLADFDANSSTAGSAAGLLPVIVVIALIVALMGLVMVAYRNLEAYERLRGWLRFLGATPALAITGLIGLLPFALIGLAGFAIARAPTGTGLIVGKWGGISLASYVALVLWGLVVRHIRKRFKQHRAALDAKQGGAS